MDRKAKSGGKVLRHLNFQAADLGSTRQPQADRIAWEQTSCFKLVWVEQHGSCCFKLPSLTHENKFQ